MGIKLPYYRIARPANGENSGYSSWAYIIDKEYSKTPEHFIRGLKIITKDLIRIFEFIEPSDINLKTYSYRIHELFLRICIEIETNFKAILSENTYNPKDKNGRVRDYSTWNILDYKIIDSSHFLSRYAIEIPVWNGKNNKFQPFKGWSENKSLSWYKAYNESKHDRSKKFEHANFENLINAFCALEIIIYSQFKDQTFEIGNPSLATEGYSYYIGDFTSSGISLIKAPLLSEEAKYSFNWSELKKSNVRFQKFNYDT